jgi:hypothetical protein
MNERTNYENDKSFDKRRGYHEKDDRGPQRTPEEKV